MKKAIAIVAVIAALGILKIVSNKSPNSFSTSGNIGIASQAASPASSPNNNSSATQVSTSYKDGTYNGNTSDTPYGPVQVAVVISGGNITNIKYLQMPSDQGHSREVTSYAEPVLKQNAIAAQSANIDFVSGATDTSFGFRSSLQAALNQAINS